MKHHDSLLRRVLSVAAALACLMACLAGLTVTTAAEAAFTMEIPYGKPTVDGVIEEGEYKVSYVMNKDSATAWVGEVGASTVTWWLAWDEDGLYYAGTINDSTPAWRDEDTHWVGMDCLELAINPGLLLEGEVAEGIFFSFGSTADGKVVAYRHNFADGLVSDRIVGVSKGHVAGTTSYTMEVHIPWSLVQINKACTVGGKENIRLNSKGFEPTVGAVLGLLPCAIDSLDDRGESIIAYKFNGTDFVVCDFINAVLADENGNTTPVTESATTPAADPSEETTTPVTESVPVSTEPATSSETEHVHDTLCDCADSATETLPADTDSAGSGCAGRMAAGATVLLGVIGCVLLRKREE